MDRQVVEVVLCSPLPLVLMFFKLEKKAKKKETKGKCKTQTYKPEKTSSKNKMEKQ
jgi:hypothetical protein